ncbi:MAG TPA: VOC family protein [Gemmatimonadales bacterium]|jgi:catechol 2,3-dioxygenase-like lactoylglutathione lyase family enzyme
MIGHSEVMATVPVKNLGAARRFYEQTLGLRLADTEGDEAVIYHSDGSKLLVYQSAYAGTNQATAVTWAVDDVPAEVKALRAKGVKFEHYDMPGATVKDDVYDFGSIKNAWCKDPDGNILAIVSRRNQP